MNVRRLASPSVVAIVGICIAASACHVRPLTLPGQERDPRDPPGAAPEGGATRADEAMVSMKSVTAKEPPTTLVADDGSRCRVSQKRYDDTRIGDTALCAWRRA